MSPPSASPYIHSVVTNQLPDRAPLLLAFCFHPFAILTSGNQVSSVGAAGVSPHPVTPWPQRRAVEWEAGGGRAARHPAGAPSELTAAEPQ